MKEKYPHEFSQQKIGKKSKIKEEDEENEEEDDIVSAVNVGEKMSILAELSEKIESLSNELKDKEKLNSELEKAYQ